MAIENRGTQISRSAQSCSGWIENPIDEKTIDIFTYRLYRVKGRFKADFLQNSTADYHRHVLGFSLNHRKLPREKLIIVGDVVNMGLTSNETLAKKMKDSQVLDPASGWSINNVSFFFRILQRKVLLVILII